MDPSQQTCGRASVGGPAVRAGVERGEMAMDIEGVEAPPDEGMTGPQKRAVWLLLGATVVAILNETTMGVAIPHLIDDLSITALAAQWLTTAFMLTMAVVIPISGFLLRRFTTRAVFTTAMSLFSTGTLIALLAPGFPFLLLARVVQASGTAILMPMLMTTLMTVVPPGSRGRMMGRISIVMALAPAIGPTLSGFILETLTWRWIFAIVLPFAVLALIAGVKWIPNLGEPTRGPLDVLSVILSALGFGSLVYGLSQIGGAVEARASNTGTDATVVVVTALVVGVVTLALFVWRQFQLQRIDDALLDLRVFTSRNFTLSALHLLFMNAGFFGTLTLLPLYLQSVAGISPLDTGLIMLPGSLLMGLLGPLIGRWYDSSGPRPLLIPGAVLATAMMWVAATAYNEHTTFWFALAVQTLTSVGLAFCMTPLMTGSLGSLPMHLYSHGSAVISTIQQVAGAAGTAILIMVMTLSSATAEAGGAAPLEASAVGAQDAFRVAAAVLIPTIVFAFLIRKPAPVLPPATPASAGARPAQP